MAPNPDEQDNAAPKRGWFDRLKASIGLGTETPAATPAAPEAVEPAVADVTATPPVEAEAPAAAVTAEPTVVRDVPAIPVAAPAPEAASVPLAPGEPLVDVTTEAAPGITPTVSADVALSPTGDVSVPVPPLQPAAAAAQPAPTPAEMVTAMPAPAESPVHADVAETLALAEPAADETLTTAVEPVDQPAPTAADVAMEMPTLAEMPAVLDEAPVSDESFVSVPEVEAPAVEATETPLPVADATAGVPAEESAPGSWLSRFTGRFGLGLGTPKAPEVAAITPTGDVAAPDGHVDEAPTEAIQEAVQEERKSWFARLSERLGETRTGLVSRVHRLTYGRTKIDEDMLEELEEILLTSDVGPKATDDVLAFLRGKAKDSRFLPDEVVPALREYLSGRLREGASPITAERGKLTIFLMVGVNGVGKTTTTGKIAAKFRLNDYKVLLAAADTFRAAAIDQLQVWAQRAGVDLIRHAEGGDAAAVVFDAIRSAKARGADVLIVDTAGRLHTKHNLMEELSKIRRIVEREAPEAAVECLLVLDATTGQNGLRQAEVFGQATPLTGVILTKLDGTAKGGVVFSIKETLGLPIRLLGVGEGLEDLREFDPILFVDALFASMDPTAA